MERDIEPFMRLFISHHSQIEMVGHPASLKRTASKPIQALLVFPAFNSIIRKTVDEVGIKVKIPSRNHCWYICPKRILHDLQSKWWWWEGRGLLSCIKSWNYEFCFLPQNLEGETQFCYISSTYLFISITCCQ